MKPKLVAAGVVLIVAGAVLLAARFTWPIDSFAKCAADGNPVSGTEPPTCSDGSHRFVGPRSSPAPSSPPIESLMYQLLVSGDSDGNYPRAQKLITAAADWQRYWREVHSGLASIPPILPVDFTTSSVIALTEGQQQTGGYGLRITGINTGPTGTIVRVTETIPSITCNVTQAISNRYFIARTPKLTEPVSFRITTDHHRCQ